MVLPNSMRLKGHRCFDHIHRSGSRYNSSSIILRVAKANEKLLKSHKLKNTTASFRCAVAISSKVSKKAVIRNRLRRTIHDHIKKRLLYEKNQPERWALISLKPSSTNKNSIPLLKECDILLKQAGLLK